MKSSSQTSKFVNFVSYFDVDPERQIRDWVVLVEEIFVKSLYMISLYKILLLLTVGFISLELPN